MSTQELRQEQVVGAERGQQPMSAAVAERRAQAAAIRRQGDQALHDGNYDRAQQLYAESDAVFSGTQPPSAALAERRARAAAIRRQGDQALHDGNWQRAQQLYQESDAVFSGKPFVSPAVAERRAAPADSGRRAQHETGGRNG